MIKIAITVLLIISTAFLGGCILVPEPAPVTNLFERDTNEVKLSGNIFGETSMIQISNSLWYDSTTKIVYLWNGKMWASDKMEYIPAPYYAPNGLPYRYNPETDTLEEISEVFED